MDQKIPLCLWQPRAKELSLINSHGMGEKNSPSLEAAKNSGALEAFKENTRSTANRNITKSGCKRAQRPLKHP